jgi:hypothetical protein
MENLSLLYVFVLLLVKRLDFLFLNMLNVLLIMILIACCANMAFVDSLVNDFVF